METLQESKPKARKDHRCSYCNGTITKGSIYNYSTHVYDGDMYTWKSHTRCQDTAVALKMFDECYEGVTQEDFIEFINCYFFDNLAKEGETFKNTHFPERLFAVQDKVLK